METKKKLKNKVTKTDIARELGVSRTCVSLVLGQQPSTRISESTREKVLKTALALGYVEKVPAYSDRTLNQIAYVFCSNTHTGGFEKNVWHIALLAEFQQLALTKDQNLAFYYTSNQPEILDATLRMLDKLKPAGVVLDGWVPRYMVNALLKRELPFIVAGVTPFAYEPQWQGLIPTVSLDINNTIGQLIDLLRQRGARRIGLVAGPMNALVNKLLVESYRKSIVDCGLGYEPSFVQIADASDGTDVLSRFEELGVDIDGLICSSLHVTAVLSHLRSKPISNLNLHRIVTIGNTSLLPPSSRQISCLDIGPREFAEAVHKLLSELIHYGPHRQKHLFLPLTLRHGN